MKTQHLHIQSLQYIYKRGYHKLYTRGKLSCQLADNTLVLAYESRPEKIRKAIQLEQKPPEESLKFRQEVQNFFIDTRYLHERDGTDTQVEALAALHKIPVEAMQKVLHNVRKNVEKYRQQHGWPFGQQ